MVIERREKMGKAITRRPGVDVQCLSLRTATFRIELAVCSADNRKQDEYDFYLTLMTWTERPSRLLKEEVARKIR